MMNKIAFKNDIEKLLQKDEKLTSEAVKKFVQNHTIKDFKVNSLKKKQKLQLKTKTWIENPQGELIFGKGKTELLEFIDEIGSLLKAAQAMQINYKKAWTHLKQIQTSSDEELVISKQGRSLESGTKLTPKAKELVIKYQILQQDIENFANWRFKELFEEDK